jgi:hypothetical protein
MKIPSLLCSLVLLAGCAHDQPKPTQPAVAAPRDYSDASDAELARVRERLPSLRETMTLEEVFAHLGVSRFLGTFRQMGSGPTNHRYHTLALRADQSLLVEYDTRGGRLLGVTFGTDKWPKT